MGFLAGDELTKAIRELKRSTKWYCAVAFWGKGSESLLDNCPDDTTIICNLRMGGTNPDVIKQVMTQYPKIKILRHDTLHAKVYIGDDYAIVTSANASINGLGLEGKEQANWVEAGVRIKADQVTAWFESVEYDSEEISCDDINRAIRDWKARKNASNERTFGEAVQDGFDYEKVLLNYQQDAHDSDSEPGVGGWNRAENCMLNEGDCDEDAISLQPWILWWSRTRGHEPSRPRRLRWHKINEQSLEANYGPQKNMKRTLGSRIKPTPPFNASETKFVEAFNKIIVKFAPLTSDHEGRKGYYLPERMDAIPEFWDALRKEYEKP